MSELTLDATLPLKQAAREGTAIPRLGLGVFRAKAGGETKQAVLWALEAGYRHIDTAAVYGNERDVGAALRESGVPRDEVFVTSKLWNDDQGYDEALAAYDRSLERLGLDALDLFLLHWPVPGKRLASWEALARLLEEGRVRSIGVSNFLVPHLEELAGEGGPLPAVNQIELSPFLQRRDTVAWCREREVVLEAYSPLTKGRRLDDPRVVEVAEAVGKTPAQVLIRWSLEHGFVCIPKSTHQERIRENAEVFDFALTQAQRASLDGLEQGLATGWDPSDVA